VVVVTLGLTNGTYGRFPAMMAGLMLAGASGLVGAFMGFLFGIPRAKQLPVLNETDDGKSKREFLDNTNLEQISDWLTKIIVGLTLVQFDKIKAFVTDVGKLFSPVFLSNSKSEIAGADETVEIVGSVGALETVESLGTAGAIGVAVILYFTIAGFLFGFLWTRIRMENVLNMQRVRGYRVLEQSFKRSREQENTANMKAFELTDGYLDPKAQPTARTYDNLEEKIAKSSVVAGKMIFDQARQVRKDNWKSGGNRKLIDRTIPIFRGLIAAKHGKQHRNYGQLGYALIRGTNPDWAAGQRALETAIELRKTDDSGQGTFEFNLALALINQDTAFLEGKASGDPTAGEISKLLDPASKVINLNDEPAIVKWAKLNGYSISTP
jgi:hypothetical protein